jgi:hypothetical protein
MTTRTQNLPTSEGVPCKRLSCLCQLCRLNNPLCISCKENIHHTASCQHRADIYLWISGCGGGAGGAISQESWIHGQNEFSPWSFLSDNAHKPSALSYVFSPQRKYQVAHLIKSNLLSWKLEPLHWCSLIITFE